MSTSPLEAFGYVHRPEWKPHLHPFGVQIVDGVNSDTLAPLVLLVLRPDMAHEDAWALPFTPDQADELAAKLMRYAALARLKSLQPEE